MLYLLMEGKWRQTGQLTFLWSLRPLVAYLRTQTKYPKLLLEVFFVFLTTQKIMAKL